MKINEVLNTNLPYEWIEYSDASGYWEAEFQINGKGYTVSIVFYEKDEYENLPDRYNIEFGLLPPSGDKYDIYTKFDITGTGDQFSVMSTVHKILTYWYDHHQDAMCFTMSADVQSRKKLYTRMIHNLLPTWKINTVKNVIIVTAPSKH